VRDEGAATYLCAMPLTHVGGRIVLSALPSGARFIIHAGFDAQALLSSIAHEQVTDLFLPPTAIYTLLAQPNVHAFDYSSLRALSYGAAPISVTQLRKALEVFGPVMRGLFGQTECPMMISALTQQDHYIDGAIASDKRLQSVGRASILSELAILDEQGVELPVLQRGEIAVKGDMVCEGYYQNTVETQQTRVNGWHLTGDIGYLDNEGFLFIVDRKKDMIISGGFNVYSAEVEFAITRIKGVAAAAVIGVPSEHWGEEVVAFVTLEPGTTIDEKSVVDFCKEAIGQVKAPKSVEFVQDLPVTKLGKIDKRLLRGLLLEHLK
jgi:fatty-acyl-CoA synthase